MKILVTGGTGFIGSHLIDELISQKNQVICLDDLSTGLIQNIASHQENKNFKFIRGTIENKSLLKKLVVENDLIFHLAALVGVSYVLNNPIKGIHVNSLATSILVDLAFKFKKKFIFASSSEVYGKNPKNGLKEVDDCLLGSPYIKRWWYAVSKLLDEHLILSYIENGLKATIVRLFNVYGPRSKNPTYSNVIPKFINQALKKEPLTVYGDGKQIRSFGYISDIVDGLIAISKKNNCLGEIINLGTKEPVTILDLAKKIKLLTRSSSKITFIKPESNFEETPVRIPNLEKLTNLVGFKSKVTLRSGLVKSINWFRST